MPGNEHPRTLGRIRNGGCRRAPGKLPPELNGAGDRLIVPVRTARSVKDAMTRWGWERLDASRARRNFLMCSTSVPRDLAGWVAGGGRRQRCPKGRPRNRTNGSKQKMQELPPQDVESVRVG